MNIRNNIIALGFATVTLNSAQFAAGQSLNFKQIEHQINANKINLSIDASLIAIRSLDYYSTEHFLNNKIEFKHQSGNYCREKELPQFVVQNKIGFAAFEIGTTALSIEAQKLMSKRAIFKSHPHLIQASQAFNVSLTARTVAGNFRDCY